MLKKQFHQQDINMGNEDTFDLVFDAERAEFFIEHWWSHRKTGSRMTFEWDTGTKRISLADFKKEHGHRLEKLVTMLRGAGFEDHRRS